MLLAEKVENLKSVTTKLEKTQKMLRLLNNGTSKLDHLIQLKSNRFFIQGHSGSVATNAVSLSAKSDTVAIEGKSTTSSSCDSDSDYGDESKKDNESL